MPIDDHIGIVALRELLGRRTSDFVAVAYVKMYSADLQIDPLGEVRVARRVSIAQNSLDRRYQAQFVQDIAASNITRV
jgi:hypothetical protein